MSQTGVPQSVYAFLRPGDPDPLPPVHRGEVFHYTDVFGLHGMIESKALWASHAQDLNDPTERQYGWDVVEDRCGALEVSERVEITLQEMLEHAREPGEWFPDPFVVSASTEPDSLTQYRLYGQHAVTLTGGAWTAAPAGETYLVDEMRAAWRPVLYGPEEARPYVDRMLNVAVRFLERTPYDEDPRQNGPLVMEMLETLALHIKDEGFRDEREVRLVFSAPRRYPGVTAVRTTLDGRLVTYVNARPIDVMTPDVVTAVRLGPLAGTGRTAEAIQLHHFNHSGLDLRAARELSEEYKLPVERTRTRLAR